MDVTAIARMVVNLSNQFVPMMPTGSCAITGWIGDAVEKSETETEMNFKTLFALPSLKNTCS